MVVDTSLWMDPVCLSKGREILVGYVSAPPWVGAGSTNRLQGYKVCVQVRKHHRQNKTKKIDFHWTHAKKISQIKIFFFFFLIAQNERILYKICFIPVETPSSISILSGPIKPFNVEAQNLAKGPLGRQPCAT